MQIFAGIKWFFSKIINTLFGKTMIFIIILGWILVISGIFMLLRPEKARKSLIGQSFGQIKWYLMIIVLFLSSLVVSFGINAGGTLSKALMIIVLILLFKAYFALRKKAYNKVSTWAKSVSIKFLKIFAAAQIAIGALMLVLHKRIWY